MIKKAVVFVKTRQMLDSVPVPLVKIGGVRLIQRVLLDARRAGIEEGFIVLDQPNAAVEACVREAGFAGTWHLVTEAEWRADQLGDQDEGILVLFGDRLYDFRLLMALVSAGSYRVLVGLDSKPFGAPSAADRQYMPNDGRVIEPASRPPNARAVGAYVCTPPLVETVISSGPDDFCQPTRAGSDDGVAYFDIGNGFVEPIASREDIRRAEKRILRYIWKETDGIYARWNKRLALPLIKLLLNTPVTPNMVSLAGLVVALVAGYFFSLGHYASSLVGAVLSYFSSLLDHIDGSLARVKSRESAFGCWFETVCDYLYYLSLAGGTTLGLYRETQSDLYLALGGAMVFGTIMSFIVTGYQRKKFTENPSQLAGKVNRQWEAHAQNPLFRFARTCHFLVRRPVLPYYVFLFTALKMLPLVLFLTALGANLVWTISLYSNRLFRIRRQGDDARMSRQGRNGRAVGGRSRAGVAHGRGA